MGACWRASGIGLMPAKVRAWRTAATPSSTASGTVIGIPCEARSGAVGISRTDWPMVVGEGACTRCSGARPVASVCAAGREISVAVRTGLRLGCKSASAAARSGRRPLAARSARAKVAGVAGQPALASRAWAMIRGDAMAAAGGDSSGAAMGENCSWARTTLLPVGWA